MATYIIRKNPVDRIPMTFFSANKPKPRRIEIDSSRIGSNNPDVQERLDRIGDHYDELELILAEMESKIKSDDRLNAIDDANVDFELTFGIKKKRKWRATKPKSKSKNSIKMTHNSEKTPITRVGLAAKTANAKWWAWV